ncbi:kinase-like protein [Ceratobasidium sp. AG-Ba]|nr:kinase-like protein [Ceratobasidium sp. AG-Ba]
MSDQSPEDQILLNAVYHVFLPPKLPQKSPGDDIERRVNYRLASLTLEAANGYRRIITNASIQWTRLSIMLSRFAQSLVNPFDEPMLERHMADMRPGDILSLHIREQNAAVIVRKTIAATTFEVFEAQAPNASVMSTAGKLIRHFPGPAIQVPSSTADDPGFIGQIANFLAQMNVDVLEGATAKSTKAGSKVAEVRDAADPHYISQLFTGILRGLGKEVEPRRVVKRIADEVLWDSAYLPWRRSPVWLIIRVALQTTIDPTEYKHFMVYLHAHLLRLSVEHSSFSSELLASMRMKMARRMLKVKDTLPDCIVQVAKDASEQIENLLQCRWTAIQNQVPHFGPLQLDLKNSIIQTLPNSRTYLDRILQGRPSRGKPPPFEPQSSVRLVDISNFSEFAGGALARSFEKYRHVALFDFEAAVHKRLSHWVANHLAGDSIEPCTIISSCLDQYMTAALSSYTQDAADLSTMALTIIELWVGLDRLAISRHSILRDYSPEIPETILTPLLLRSSLHLERARVMQTYLRQRHRGATHGSFFSSKTTQQSLPVRFFQQSASLQETKNDIERDAELKRNRKLEELERLNAQHDQLRQRAAQMECTYTVGPTGKQKHKQKRCEKCQLQKQAKNMSIAVHEWPLPTRELDAQTVVFELQCPEELNVWRANTQKILCDLAGVRQAEAAHHGTLATYDGLQKWASGLKYRITVASSTKSFRKSHYGNTKIPSTGHAVCVNNGLNFKLFDSDQSTWASGSFSEASFSKFGNFVLPKGSLYSYLQHALEGTTHTSNQIIADQSGCPNEISLHEHYAFGTLRSGPRLQWMNMVRGLEENLLTYSREEIYILHTQAAWQLGPLSEDGQDRDWHLELDDPEFARLLVGQASRVLDRVRTNWLESTTVHTIVTLITRLLSSTTDTYVCQEAHWLLRDARDITFGWVEELSHKLQNADIETEELQQRICEMALICRSTYDTDNSHLVELLSSSKDWIAFIACSIVLYDNRPPKPQSASSHLQTLLSRDRRLASKALPILLDGIKRNTRVLDDAISRYWNSYSAGAQGWNVIGGQSAQWVTTDTVTDENGDSQRVHLNLLEGRLLIDGQPFGRLPPEYVAHPTYARLFGQISFSLDASKNLIVQASQCDTVLELVPHSKLAKDFPAFFLSQYHHWMNCKTGVLEFRPIDEPWNPSNRNWRLCYSTTSISFMEIATGSGFSSLIDLHSTAFQKLAAQIAPLESPDYLHITQSDHPIPEITVELPRMKLAFVINENMQLESQNFRGQIIDTAQSSGTMFGLNDQLILCTKDSVSKSLPRSRAVLIPDGRVEFTLRSNHTHVTIDRGSARYIAFHHYQIDEDLGYLANTSTSLTSRLFKIYLHALTSHCLPDPLTGRTGTEEALHELSEAATTSFDQLNEEQARLLRDIGSLTPKRKYYPPHLKTMQTTQWAKLPALSQHYAFCTTTNSVLERARSLQLFNPLSFDVEPYEIKYDRNLLKRAALRTRNYYPADTVGRLEIFDHDSGSSDSSYEGKDHPASGWTDIGQRAAWAAGLMDKNWNRPFRVAIDLTSLCEQWNEIKGLVKDISANYGQEWLHLKLPSSWLSLYDLCRGWSGNGARYGFGINLAAGVYAGWLPLNLVPALAAVTINPQFRSIATPKHAEYRLSDKYAPNLFKVLAIITSHCLPVDRSPSVIISRNNNEPKAQWRNRRKAHYDSNISSLKPQLASYWMSCWPTSPTEPSGVYSSWFNISGCLQQVQAYFKSCLRNIDIKNYLNQVESFGEPHTSSRASAGLKKHASFAQLLHDRAPCALLDVSKFELSFSVSSNSEGSPDTERLMALLGELRRSVGQPLRQRYAADLEASRIDLTQARTQQTVNMLPSLSELEQNRSLFRNYLQLNYGIIVQWLGPTTCLENIAAESGVWPRLTPRVVLGKLALQARRDIPARYCTELAKYARSYVEYQRSQRLISLTLEGKHEEFYKELEFANADAEKEVNDPDWILIEGNFTARSVQAQVAREMIVPASNANTVLQLNMGEGKSSVIVPIVAAALADTTRLVRVVVLKPLWHQMFHLLVSRLSGLVNRRIYYLPFGRHIRVGESQAKLIQDIYMECMREGGILLAQPEHILSFKLMGVDQLLSYSTNKAFSTARRLQDMERWLQNNARDILDESDEILHVRYQLVYTVGEQQSLEGHPDRWTTTQQVLSLVANHIRQLKETFPDKLKYEARNGGQFPFIRIMPESDDAVANLIGSVAKDAVKGLVHNLNFGILSRATNNMALRILTIRDISMGDKRLLGELDPVTRNGLLLLRGLLAYGIIAFALRDKHYRVDYGLHLTRCLLAVPYHAKDIPSIRAEFGHPDVAIVLTCLSYYNHGLTQDQLRTCFELLFKLDNPDVEYDQWVHRNKQTPASLRLLKGVNLKDHEQFTNQIVPTFSYNAAVVNFFLSWVVFPKEAKQFPHKLSTSGWDLAEVKANATTGFSGTNDNRYLLPTSITQSDPVKQSSTNALVLTYLLQPENNHYLCIRGASGETCSATEFMDMLVKQTPEIRVLLDVGAQMLELTNDELVRYWLKLRPDISAAVYFNNHDELVILPQNGSPSSFHSSPFAQQMDKCIVYLDDGHTRGTDLKLPKGTRAAVTLGPKVTKDRLLQGCMRMRKLGFGQSVMFCAPIEIDHQIRKVGKIETTAQVEALDVLRWTMLETCKDLEHHASHWIQQGVEHHRRADALKRFARGESTNALQRGWMTPESRSLEEMYGADSNDSEFVTKALGIPSLRRQLEELGIRKLRDPGMDEEQEREVEVNHEVERERQVERPVKLQAASHSTHPEIWRFIQSGNMPRSWAGVVPLFLPLKGSGALQANAWSSKLFATLDFCKTLTTSSIMEIGDYMRPLNWVLSNSDGYLLAISPYEANQLLPDIRKSLHVRLHVFAPRVAQSMLSFSELRFYSPPSLVRLPASPPDLIIQLQISLFAGQLYFESYTHYRVICGFLGIFIGFDSSQEADDLRVQSDGFILQPDRQRLLVHIPEVPPKGDGVFEDAYGSDTACSSTNAGRFLVVL